MSDLFAGILKEAQSTLFTDHEIEKVFKFPLKEILFTYLLKGTVILDVDSGKWILAPPNQLELPTRISTLLKKHLERLKSSAELRKTKTLLPFPNNPSGGQSFNQMVTHIFLFIWVELFIGFSKCFTDNQFNTDRFIKSRTPPYRTVCIASLLAFLIICSSPMQWCRHKCLRPLSEREKSLLHKTD